MRCFLPLVLLAAFLVTVTQGYGSEEEAKAIENLEAKWKKMMDDETFDTMTPKLYDTNATIVVNGHKAVKGIAAASSVMQLWEEWGPGITFKTNQLTISESNDLAAAIGTGKYKDVEEFSFLRVFKKIDNEWKIHMEALHEWVIEDKKAQENILERRKRGVPLITSEVKITGNNSAAKEAQDLYTTWLKNFQAHNAQGIADLYVKDCVALDDNNKPMNGKESIVKIVNSMLIKYTDKLVSTLKELSASSAGDLVAGYGLWTDDGTYGNFVCVMKRENGVMKYIINSRAHETPM